MRVIDIMTKEVITVNEKTSVTDALKLMKERKFRRLPVVDENGQTIGIVTQERLENIKPSAGTPVLWQIHYLIAHTTVGDVMRKGVVTVTSTDSVEYAVAKAQSNRVGTLIVVDEDNIVGICTTNDFFYGILNPLLGIGEGGSRIVIVGGGDIDAASKIISYINEKGLTTKVIWAIKSLSINKNNLVLHLNTETPAPIVEELNKMGYEAHIQQR
jgi:acetoin utilization protein AcuB